MGDDRKDRDSKGDTDIHGSEIEVLGANIYKEIKKGNLEVKISDEKYTCPYCPGKTKRDYLYKELFQHASGIGNGNSQKRSVREKASHLALAKYLENDVQVKVSTPKEVADLSVMGHDLMNQNLNEGTDINESEMEEYKVKMYEDLKKGNCEVQISSEKYTCPCCPGKRKRDYFYEEILQHASGVGTSNSRKRSATEKASHLALAQYLENDVQVKASTSKEVAESLRGDDEMNCNLNEDIDISESEMEEYEVKMYEDLKKGKFEVKISDDKYTCPSCPEKRKRDYFYKELLQHASGVGTGSSRKRSAREKASHLALAKYLKEDVQVKASTSNEVVSDDPLSNYGHDELFVWPWTGIIVNIPTYFSEGRYVGESGSKLRDELRARGFNPKRVQPLWNFRGHSGTAVVEFNKDWLGLNNALSFDKAYDLDHHGKKDWLDKSSEKSGLYAWVARIDDYNSDGIVGEHLHKIGDLRTLSDMMAEEAQKTNKLVLNLTNVLEDKDKTLKEVQSRFSETMKSINNLMQEKDKLHNAYNEEIKKIQLSARDHLQKIFNDHSKLKLQLEMEVQGLELRGQELEKREARNESERKRLEEEIEKNALKNSSLHHAAMVQEKIDENVLKLAEEQKRQKEELHKKILKLQNQLEAKQALELEIEQLRGALNVMRHVEDEGDNEVIQKVDSMIKELREKEEELGEVESLNQTLIVKERRSNEELQDARKELINGLKDMLNRAVIGIKRMGELDTSAFKEACQGKYPEEMAEDKAVELCSLWDEYLRDPAWHPFKVVKIEGKDQEIINQEDERLQGLRNDLGDEVCNAVVTALREINEHNPSGRYIITELWNYIEGRRATMAEGVSVLVKKWKAYKGTRV